MPFTVQCDSCSKRFSAPDSYEGKAVPCPNCGKTIRCTSFSTPEPTQQSPQSPDQSAASIFSLSEADLVDDHVAGDIAQPVGGSRLKKLKKKKPRRSHSPSEQRNFGPFILPAVVLVLSMILFVAGVALRTKGALRTSILSSIVPIGLFIATMGFGTAYFGRKGVWGFIDHKLFGGLAYLNCALSIIAVAVGFVVSLTRGESSPLASIGGLIAGLLICGLIFVVAMVTWRVGYSRFAGTVFCIGAIVLIPTMLLEGAGEKNQSGASRIGQTVARPESMAPSADVNPNRQTEFPSAGSFQPFDSGIHKSETLIDSPFGEMQVTIYAPANRIGKKFPAVLIAPAGAYPLTGMRISDGDKDECLPYVRAGFVAVNYSISGHVADDPPTDRQLKTAMQQYRAAKGGVENTRQAIAFIRQQCPFVDMNRLYTSGHSSAGTVSLLAAAKISEIKACVAFAAVTDCRSALQANGIDTFDLYRQLNPNLPDDLEEFSPIRCAHQLRSPVFLFHDREDQNVNCRQSERMAKLVNRPTLKLVSHSDHYTSMIELGMPAAVRWLAELDAKATASQLLASSGINLTPEEEQALTEHAGDGIESLLAEAGVTPDGRFVDDPSNRSRGGRSEALEAARRRREEARAKHRDRIRQMLEETGHGDLADELDELRKRSQERREEDLPNADRPVPRNTPRNTPRKSNIPGVRLKGVYMNAKEAYHDQLAYFVAKPDVLDENLRLWKNGKRPMTGFRIGIGVVSTGHDPVSVSVWPNLLSQMGNLGESIVFWGRSPEVQDIVGEWPSEGYGSISGFVMLGTVDNRKALMKLAKARELHGLLTIATHKRLAGGKWQSVHRLIFEDLTGSDKKWNSKSIPEGTPGIQIRESLASLTPLMRVRYLRTRMPKMSREKVIKRYKSLDVENENPHGLVLEFFKYHQDELITDKQFIGIIRKLAPKLPGESLVRGDEHRRYKTMTSWLRRTDK